MELILLQKVVNLGNLGDKVNVKPGYGRNFLVPQGKAVPATAANLATLRARLNAPLLAHWTWDPNATPAELARSLRLS